VGYVQVKQEPTVIARVYIKCPHCDKEIDLTDVWSIENLRSDYRAILCWVKQEG